MYFGILKCAITETEQEGKFNKLNVISLSNGISYPITNISCYNCCQSYSKISMLFNSKMSMLFNRETFSSLINMIWTLLAWLGAERSVLMDAEF